MTLSWPIALQPIYKEIGRFITRYTLLYADAARSKYYCKYNYSAAESHHTSVRFAWFWTAEHVPAQEKQS